jgi:hypothetical protein
MNLHHLADVLRGNVAPNNLLNEIRTEVGEYRAAFRKRGSSRPIFVTEDNLQFVLGREEVKRLCSLFLEGMLDEWQLQYLANAIDLASSFIIQDEKVRDAIFRLADPEVNLPLNTTNVAALCESL